MIEIDPLLIRQMAENSRRVDGRACDSYREISVETGVVLSAEGSARVRIGDTDILAGVKIDVGEPFADTPDEGVLMVGVEFVPLANPEFEAGPPREGAVEIARVVDRAVRESKSIDVKKLCITPGEKVWMVYIDVDVLNDHGNLIDAISLASLAALMSANLPVLGEDGRVDRDKKGTEPLPISGKPLCTTFALIGGQILADPSLPEMRAMDARLTVGTFERDGRTLLCSMQKGGTAGMSLEEIEQIIGLAERKGSELRKLLD